MTRTEELISAFISCNSLANAEKLVAHVDRVFFLRGDADFLTEDHLGVLHNAERIVADAKDPKKTKEAMQRELKARFPGMNIIVC
jgi:hypothetical protein